MTTTHTCNSCGTVYGPFDFVKVFTWKENNEYKGLICETCLDARPLPVVEDEETEENAVDELGTLQVQLKDLYNAEHKTAITQKAFDRTFARIMEIKAAALTSEGWKPEDGNAARLAGSSVFTASNRPTYGGSRFYR